MQHTIKPPESYKIPCYTVQHTMYRLCRDKHKSQMCGFTEVCIS